MSHTLDEIRHFLLDLDGTLYVGDVLIDGAQAFVDALQRTGRDKLFLTNNSSASVPQYHRKLTSMGITASPDEIFTSATATIIYLKRQGAGSRLCLLATPEVEAEFASAGFEICNERPDYVVLAFDKTLTYEKLQRASEHIQRGVPFIATHPDWVCPTADLSIPDCGAMISMVTAATGITPKVIGKPNREMITSALARLGAKAENTAIVGDRLYTDMAMGFDAGLMTILVLSGEAELADVEVLERRPDLVLGSVAELVGML